MPRYKLVRIEDSRLISGEELRQQLLAEGFTMPVIAPLELLPRPVAPPKPLTSDPVEVWRAYVTANHDYQTWLAGVNAENAIRRLDYFDQFIRFADVLAVSFVIATGIYESATRTWSYSIVDPCLYSYQQAADKLMGKYKPLLIEPIEFICNKYF